MSRSAGRGAVDRTALLAYVRAFSSQDRTQKMLFTFLLVIHAIIAATLVTVILMQRSEGGGLGMGGSPSGLMSARGAADFLTRTTSVLAMLFVGMSILLAVLASTRGTVAIDPALARRAPAGTSLPTAPPPAETAPFAGAAGAAVAPPSNAATAPGNDAVPLAQ